MRVFVCPARFAERGGKKKKACALKSENCNSNSYLLPYGPTTRKEGEVRKRGPYSPVGSKKDIEKGKKKKGCKGRFVEVCVLVFSFHSTSLAALSQRMTPREEEKI